MTSYAARRTGDAPGPEPAPRRPLRVAYFTDTFAPTHDGVAKVTAALAEALARRGIEVVVYTVRAPGQPRHERLPGPVEVHRSVSLAAPNYPEYRVALFPHGPFGSAPKRAPFDLVHVHTPGFVGLAGWATARHHGWPLVTTYHTDLAGMLGARRRSPAARAFFRGWGEFNRWLCWTADAATAPTSEAAATLVRGRADSSRSEVTVVPNGVDVRRFRPDAPGPDWSSRLHAEGRPIITFLGRLTRDKGVMAFLDAVVALPDSVRLLAVVGGTGPESAVVRARMSTEAALRERGRFLGPVAEVEKPALLAQSAAFVLPSTADTSSVALLEALACGAAGIVTDRGGPSEIARASGAALVVDPSEPAAIGRAIQQLVNEPTERRRLGAAGVEWVRREASLEQMAESFLALYQRLAAARSGGPAGAAATPAPASEPGSRSLEDSGSVEDSPG